MKWGYSGYTKGETRAMLKNVKEKETMESLINDYYNEQHYCCNCDKDVEVTIKQEDIGVVDIDKEVISNVTGDIAYCNVCNSEIYIATLSDENIDKAHKALKG